MSVLMRLRLPLGWSNRAQQEKVEGLHWTS